MDEPREFVARDVQKVVVSLGFISAEFDVWHYWLSASLPQA